MINYTLTRSKRKTLALYIRDGKIEVRAPLKASKKDIDKFILSKEGWISEKLLKSAMQADKRKSFALSYGDLIIYRGVEYPIVAGYDNRAGFDGKVFYLPEDLSSDGIKEICIQVYRLLAKQYLTSRVHEFSQMMSTRPTSIKVNSAKTRWGSCSAKRSLNFSWRLMMADDDVIDYIVVHELAHIHELNHSDRFWAIVERTLPDYKMRQIKLQKLQEKLNNEDW